MARSFNIEQCAIPQLWCGEEDTPPKKKDPLIKYTKTGSRYECMKKGFGAGTHTERRDHLPTKSLQTIKYVGEKHEANLKRAGYKDVDVLVREMKKLPPAEVERVLKRALVKSTGTLDQRAYNCVLVYLYQHGVGSLPACVKISS
jgi:hypothetical protein